MFDCKSIQIDESSSSDSESVENESSCSRKIYCPQLMVMDISSKSVYAECKKKMEKAEATLACNVSVASSVPLDGVSNIFAASLIHHFPREGGSVNYGDVVLEYIPQPVPADTMRIRLYIAYPFDKKEWYNQVCLQRVGLIGLMVQTFIAIELNNFNNGNTNDLRPYIPFLDDCWTKQLAEVPMEERTMTSGTYVSMSESHFTNMTPSVALLQLDKTAVELAHERHLAKYIRNRLSLLGQLDANRILHLVFLLCPHKVDGITEKDKIETILDLSVIKSSTFYSVPPVVSQVHYSLRNMSLANDLPGHYCWRVMSWHGDEYTLRHTRGGTVASYLGAVMHEVGHLFKIPHTDSGIMRNGGENIQAFFLPNKKINLGFTTKELPQLQRVEQNASVVYVQISKEFIIKRIMESFFDSTTKLLMTVHPLITHKSRGKMCPILYDEDTGVVEVESGVRYLVYYTDDDVKIMYSFTEQYMKKKLILRTEKSTARALIVTGEGNFLSVLVTNKN